jgi:hypothetical protein
MGGFGFEQLGAEVSNLGVGTSALAGLSSKL